MTVGMRTIHRIGVVQSEAKALGFRFDFDELNSSNDRIALTVIEDVLPGMRDNSVVFYGDLDEVEAFIEGISWARRYDLSLGLQTNKRREKVEQRLRNKKLLTSIKGHETNEA